MMLLAQQAAEATPHPLKFWAYAGFIALVLFFLALDLGVFHKSAHDVSFKEAATWSVVWIVAALLFGVGIYFAYDAHWLGLGLDVPLLGKPGQTETLDGKGAATKFLTGYLIEQALSMDNVFVIALIFGYFGIPGKYQHRVLFWGILGAQIMRGAMIGVGSELIHRFSWIIYVFGALLILTALKMALMNSEPDPAKNPLVRLVKRLYPVTDQYDGQKFITKIDGRRHATPLLLALVMIEFTDLIFAVDSIPAIFAITADPFIVFTSNIFAILGLRSLYFCLASMINRFRFLKPALIVILAFVGVKMLLVNTAFKIDTFVSLGVVLTMLIGAVVLSALLPPKPAHGTAHGPSGGGTPT